MDDIVVADHAIVAEAVDAVEVLGSGTSSFIHPARGAAEAPVVVGKESAEDLVGGVHIGGAGEAQFAGESILEGALQAFDEALGLWTASRDVGDAELNECATELSWLSFSIKLFL